MNCGTLGRVLAIAVVLAATAAPPVAHAAPIDDFVAAFYVNALGRQADPAGQASWRGFLAANCNPSGFETIARSFFGSPEFRDVRRLSLGEIVVVIYRTFLGRDPDPGGFQTWSNTLRQQRLRVAAGFIGSSEFQGLVPNRSDSVAVEPVVRRFYTEVLGRPAETGGLASWTNYVISTGDLDGAAQGFLTSPEFESRRLSIQDYVRVLFRTFLGREPDPAGLEAWSNALQAELLGIIATGFIPAPEFQGLVPRLCGSAGGGGSSAIVAGLYRGTARTVIRYFNAFGAVLGDVNYATNVDLTIRPPEVAPAGGQVETNPFSLRIGPTNTAQTGNEGVFDIDSAGIDQPGSLTAQLLLQYWTLQVTPAGWTGTLTEDHREEAAALNLINTARELVPGRPNFGSIPLPSAIREGTTMTATITGAQITLVIQGGVVEGDRVWVTEITVTRVQAF